MVNDIIGDAAVVAPDVSCPAPASLLLALTDDDRIHFDLADASGARRWQLIERSAIRARSTELDRRLAILLPAIPFRDVLISIRFLVVLERQVVNALRLTLDGVPPVGPITAGRHESGSTLDASFRLPGQYGQSREPVIEMPFIDAFAEPDLGSGDSLRQRLSTVDIKDLVLSAPPAAGPTELGALFWPGEPWSVLRPASLVDVLPGLRRGDHVAAKYRHLTVELPMLTALLRLIQPDHVWSVPGTPLASLARGAPTADSLPAGRLAVVATLFDLPNRGTDIANLAGQFEDAVLLLACAEDFGLRRLLANPLLAPHVHVVGSEHAILIASLGGLRQAGGSALVGTFLLLLERIGANSTPWLTEHGEALGWSWWLRHLGHLMTAIDALNAATASTAILLLSLAPECTPAAPDPDPAMLRDLVRALPRGEGVPLGLIAPALRGTLDTYLGHLAAAVQGQWVGWKFNLSAHDLAFRVAGLLAGWQQFGLPGNATAGLAQRLHTGQPGLRLYPKALKPFNEYIDFYKAEARIMAAGAIDPNLRARLDKLSGGLDHVVRQNQAAREIEIALRLLGDRHKGEEIVWVDAGCSYGVIMNAVVPPTNIRDRCSFLGFDMNAPAIERATIVGANLGHAHYRFEVGDLAEARALALGRRVHLTTAFEVLEHGPDPVAVLRDYRAMDPCVLVVSSPLSEQQGILPGEQHLWGFDGEGFTALVEEAGFAPIGLNMRYVGRFVDGNDWVMVTATTGDPKTMRYV
jgi:methyltransferase family protein